MCKQEYIVNVQAGVYSQCASRSIKSFPTKCNGTPRRGSLSFGPVAS